MQQVLRAFLSQRLRVMQNNGVTLLAMTILLCSLFAAQAAAREKIEIVEENLPAPVEYVDDNNMLYGDYKVLRKGVGAKYQVEYRIRRDYAKYDDLGNIKSKAYDSANGRQKVEIVKTREISRKLLREPKHELILRGMRNTVRTENGVKPFSRSFTAHVSAYTHIDDSSTASGLWPRKGLVAVDTDVIPFYTKLYIPGYGECIAADTGGMIEDNCIDVFFETEEECYSWGRRDIEVYVLKD